MGDVSPVAARYVILGRDDDVADNIEEPEEPK